MWDSTFLNSASLYLASLIILILIFNKSSTMSILIGLELAMLINLSFLILQLSFVVLSAFSLITFITLAVSGSALGLVSLVSSTSASGKEYLNLSFTSF